VLALLGMATALGLTALMRPYADNQRNWLVLGAVLAAVAATALLVSRPFREFAARIRSEWSNGGA